MVQLDAARPRAAAQLFAKLEMLNPGGSVKDRIGVAMIEAAEAEGAHRARPHDDRRGDERQHRHRARVRVRRQGLRPRAHAPAGHEPRARGAAAPLRRAGPRHRVAGRDERGGRRRPGARARRRRLAARPVLQPRQPRGAPPHHRARRSGRRWTASIDYLVAGVGTGGTITGAGALPEGAQPGPARSSPSSRPPRRCCPAAGPARTRSRASARASSRRCSTASCSTRSSRSTTRTRSRPRASPPAARACWPASPCGAALCGRARRSPQREAARGKRIAVVLPDSRRALRLDAVLRARARARDGYLSRLLM